MAANTRYDGLRRYMLQEERVGLVFAASRWLSGRLGVVRHLKTS